MSKKGREVLATSQATRKRGYVSWNSEMEGVLISVLYEQLNQGNKGEGDWKPQAYHAVADALNTRMGLSINADHVRNRLKVWKRHYNTITEIRATTKFNWDDERKMVVITIEDLADWLKYCEENQEAKQYQNKPIENWDDICVLVGPDRATGDESEHPEESATAMDVEAERSNQENSSSSGSNKRLRNDRERLSDAVVGVAESLQRFVDSRTSSQPTRLSGQEVYEVVSRVPGILRHQVLRAIRRLMNGNPDDFHMLKSLPEDEKLDWILLINAE